MSKLVVHWMDCAYACPRCGAQKLRCTSKTYSGENLTMYRCLTCGWCGGGVTSPSSLSSASVSAPNADASALTLPSASLASTLDVQELQRRERLGLGPVAEAYPWEAPQALCEGASPKTLDAPMQTEGGVCP